MSEQEKEKLFWNRYHTIYGKKDLAVAFTATFSAEKDLFLDQEYFKHDMVYKNEYIRQVYAPATHQNGTIVFRPRFGEDWDQRNLRFKRRHDGRSGIWVVAARHGENFPFGFSSWMSKNENYLSLVFPGITGEFQPTFFKIKYLDPLTGFDYLVVTATEIEGALVVAFEKCDEAETPPHLKEARPL